MINKQKIEQMFDYLDGVAITLYENLKKNYLESINEAFNFLLDGEFEETYEPTVIAEISQLKELLGTTDFSREEVRKAVQLCLLRGYKQENLTNGLITPDTIGIFIAYLVKKLYQNKDLKTVFDPLVGTGNLIYTLINNLEYDIKAFGVDNDLLKCKLSRNIGDMMEIDNEIFFQDTFSYYNGGFDLIISDIDRNTETLGYFPYQVINHHIKALKENKYMIALIDNDFFEQEKNQVFREEILKEAHIFGLIKLNESLFKGIPKSILLLKKKGTDKKIKDFLLVDLPSFNDMEDFNHTVNQIDLWFSEREDLL